MRIILQTRYASTLMIKLNNHWHENYDLDGIPL